jgi:Vitamin K-dependent gamma-carboxylase
MQSPTIGSVPWLPGFLRRRPWFSEPVPAVRLAALRIGTGLIFLIDLLLTAFQGISTLFGPGGLAGPGMWPEVFTERTFTWSLLRWLPPESGPWIVFALGFAASAGLIAGWKPRLMALLGWMVAVSLFNSGVVLNNAGDRIRNILLFLLIFCPSGAVWSISAKVPASGQTVHPWMIRILFIQLVFIYFMNGVYKLSSPPWLEGRILNDVLNHAGWSHISPDLLPISPGIARLLTWFTLLWEVGFPIWVLDPRIRVIALAIGVGFHLATLLLLEVGIFPLYALCLYLPLVPWERLSRTARTAPQSAAS